MGLAGVWPWTLSYSSYTTSHISFLSLCFFIYKMSRIILTQSGWSEEEHAKYLACSKVLSWLPLWFRQCLQCRRPEFDPWIGRIPCRRGWQPTPVFLPAEFHWQSSLVNYCPRDHKESDMTEWLTTKCWINALKGPLVAPHQASLPHYFRAL